MNATLILSTVIIVNIVRMQSQSVDMSICMRSYNNQQNKN